MHRPELAYSTISTVFGVLAQFVLALFMAAAAISLRAEVIYWPLTGLDLARQRGTSLRCVNNLRQIVLAARAWSVENGGGYPAGIQVFTNKLGSPAALVCPADVSHQASTNWGGLDWEQIDYEWIAGANWNNPDDITCKCRIHENVARVDGSVQSQSFRYRSGWPAIVASPIDQYATPGSEVRFEVRVAPDALLPVRYQWQREHLDYATNVTFVGDLEDPNGGYWATNRRANFTITLLSGQTNSNYVIGDAQTNHSDYYSVVVSNALGATASSRARLFVDPSVASMAADNHWSGVNCVNNLKQIALFGRMWATDADDYLPQSLATMTNAYGLPAFGWPIVLYCRFDSGRSPPADWASLDFSDTSYELLPVNLRVDDAPSAPFCRCKAHGFYAQADGQVIQRPHFRGIRLLTNNTTELSYTTFAGQNNVVEASTNLIDWAALSIGPSTNGNFLLYETNVASWRFYRIHAD